MFYRLKDNVGLRKWKYIDRAVYIKGHECALGVSNKDFETLLLCDSHHNLNEDEVIESLLKRHFIEECKEGQEVNNWSKLKSYDNFYFPKMNLMVTGRCNLNCLHCFNAKDNAPLNTEWKFDELLHLLDEARDIGVHAFTLTGGEPLIHPRFMDIVKAIYERDMFIFELNTNGFLITQKMLDEFKKIGCNPLIKISFDGIGYHNWIRQNMKAEEKTIEAIKLCIKNGFDVKAQTQVNVKNLDSMMITAKLLDSLGVYEMRIIRTTEAPRWEKNSPNSSLSYEDYYGKMLEFCKEYQKSNFKMNLDVWQFLRLYPKYKQYEIMAIKCSAKEYNYRIPMCKGNRGMIAISSSGEVVPCLQMSGYFAENNISLANVHKASLKEIITNSKYANISMAPLFNLIINNDKCASCKYFKACAGGCPALGLLYSGNKHDFYHEDSTKCYFFENGWYEKVTEALKSWKLIKALDL